MTAPSAAVLQLRITLQDIDPPVWRRIQVPATYTFWDLHVAIQDAMGWRDCHLHSFSATHLRTGQVEHIGIPLEDGFEEDDIAAGWERRVADCLTPEQPRAAYEYDFGDGWQHEVVLEEVLPRAEGTTYPRCLAGARACPPEDVGGVWGYQDFLDSLGDATHEEHEQNLTWIGGAFDPEAFQPTWVRFDDPLQRWRDAFGAALHPGGESPGEPTAFADQVAADGFIDDPGTGQPPTGVAAFEGLSPAEMHELLTAPLSSASSPMVLNTDLPDEAFADAPYPDSCRRYLRMLRERQPLKLTQRGNLPRRFVADLWQAGLLTEDARWMRESGPLNEGDSRYLTVINLATAHSGLTRKRHGTLALTRRAEGLLDGKPAGALYRHLFEHYTTRYNWAHGDLHPPVWILQGGFGFSLLLLQRYGGEWRSDEFYAEHFRQAFPAVVREFPTHPRLPPQQQHARAYRLRVLDRFAVRFGLAEAREVPGDTSFVGTCLVRAMPLLEKLVQWRPGEPADSD